MIKNKKLSGSITVFAALIFLAVFSLFITLIQSAYHSATKARIDSALALAAESAFAGYSNEVFNRYGIFVLSSSSDALARTKEVLAANMAGSKAGLTGVSFTNEIRMTDNGGEPFYRQAVDYMKSEGVAAYVNDMLSDESKTAQNGGKIGDLAEKLGNSTNTGASEEKILEDINRIMGEENAGDTSGVSSSVKRDLQNAAEKETGQGEVQRNEKSEKSFSDIKSLLSGDLTRLVLGENGRISGKRMEVSGWEQNERLVKRDSLSGVNVNTVNDVLLREYILMTFNNYTESADTGDSGDKLDYGVEYIIGGKTSDKQNLDAVIRRIFLIREGMNFTYILTHGELKEQAALFAAALFGWTLNPLIIKAAEYGVIALWAAGESVADLRCLYGGGKVPLIKSPDTWNLSLEGLMKGRLNPSASERNKGFDYKGYLRIILLGDNSIQCARAMDLIEMRMMGLGFNNFRMRDCIFAMGVKGDFVLPFGRHIYAREYEYAYSK